MHSSIVMPLMGVKGTTSTAPMRGWPALVRVHVYVLECDFRGFEKRFLNRRGSSDEAYDETVVIFVRAVVEEIDSAFAFKAVYYFIYNVLSSSLAEIRYAFN